MVETHSLLQGLDDKQTEMITTTQKFGMCDVCRLIDFDTTEKLCNYCGMCDAWICLLDTDKWGRRIKAAIKRKLEPNYKGLQNYEEIATKSIKREQTL